jgi:Terminase-like family.
LLQPITIRAPELFPHQATVKENFAPFNVLCWGGQAGKTWFSAQFQAAYAVGHRGDHLWVDRDSKFARDAFRRARWLLPARAIREISRVDLCYRLWNGSEWWFFSGMEPDALRGHRRSSVVFNEASYITETAWTEAVGPRLAGWAIFNFTPKGLRNWTYRTLWCQADGRDPLWHRSRAISYDNPTNRRERLDEARNWLPESTYRQEILAEFVSDFGRFFNPAPGVWTGRWEAPQKAGRYVAGVDWGRHRDFTAWAVVRVDVVPARMVAVGRLPHVEYTAQVPLVAAQLQAYGNPPCAADRSQETANELLRAAGCSGVSDFVFTAASKSLIADQLRVTLEKAELLLPATAERRKALVAAGHGAPDAIPLTDEAALALRWLDDELEYFEPYLAGGSWHLGARGEHHDDMVTALMLANHMAVTVGRSAGGGLVHLSIGGHGAR